jgi:glycolate oxidase iron-sulfur subunit
MFPRVGETTILLLETLGYEVLVVDHGCCGLPAFSHGASEAAMRLAEKNIRAFSNLPECVFVTDCSSCSSFLKEYPRLFALGETADTVLLSKAEQFAARVRDVTEILSLDSNAPSSVTTSIPTSPIRVTFHDPCHLSRRQRLSHLPRMILRSLPGIEFIEMNEADSCCGGAGAFAVEHPDLSLRILERKIESIISSKADIVATTCPSCLMQIRSGLESKGSRTQAVHLVELVPNRLCHSHSKS